MRSRSGAYVSALSLLFAPAALSACEQVDGHGCSGEEVRTRAELDRLPELQEIPTGATGVHSNSVCDADEPFVYAARTFTAAAPAADIQAHFRAVAERGGWRQASKADPGPSTSLLCSSRVLFGSGATLTLVRESERRYRWEAVVDPRTGDNGC